MSLITNEQSLIGAKSSTGRDIPVYDDGFGTQVWIHRNSMGVVGIVRAQTAIIAWEICEDEFSPEATESLEEIIQEYNKTREHVKMIYPISPLGKLHDYFRPAERGDYPLRADQFAKFETVETPSQDGDVWRENELFQEAFGFRPSGPNARDKLGHGIYSKDMNGEYLDLLTQPKLDELQITLIITQQE